MVLIPEGLAVLLFVASVLGVYVASFAMVWSRLLSRRDPGQRHRSARRILEPLTHGLAIFGLGCIGYGRWVEPFRLETTYVTVTSAKLAPAAEPIRVAQFSDLHSDEVERLEPILIERLRQLQPDLITFTGDTSNSRSGDPVATECLRAISGIAPTFAVKGNWDSSRRAFQLFEKAGITELDGTGVTLQLNGSEVWLGGMAVGNEGALDLAAMRPPRDLFSIVLYHKPDLVPEISARGFDLYLTGHTHGGQVALPVYGALITLSKFGKRYEAGLYREGETAIYVNRGIGMEGGAAPRVRFCAKPELTVIELRPAR